MSGESLRLFSVRRGDGGDALRPNRRNITRTFHHSMGKATATEVQMRTKAVNAVHLVLAALAVGVIVLAIFGLAYWHSENKTKKIPPNKENKPKPKI
jgi:hypothetical protein